MSQQSDEKPVHRNRGRARNFERERATHALRGLFLFLFVAMFLGLAIAGAQKRIWFPESLWDLVTYAWGDGQ